MSTDSSKKPSKVNPGSDSASANQAAQTEQNTQVFNVLLLIICSFLVIIGLWQIFTDRMEDGLINVLIGVGLGNIPLGNWIDYKTAPLWQKVVFGFMAVFVVALSVFLIFEIAG